MCNLSQLEHLAGTTIPDHPNAEESSHVSDDVVHQSGRSRSRKRGIPWSEEEHRLFLLGLQKVGKGDWGGISRNFVRTRTPTEVVSPAQKYFFRQSNQNRRRRRSSLFDITTNLVRIPVIPAPPLSKMSALDLNRRNFATDLDSDHMPLSLKLPTQDENSTPRCSDLRHSVGPRFRRCPKGKAS